MNPIAAQAAALMETRGSAPVMTAQELNQALVGPGGKPVRSITPRQRFYVLLGWLVMKALWVFGMLFTSAWITKSWPAAPWCKLVDLLLK